MAIDFRRLDEGLGGQKNKQLMDLDVAIPSSKRQALPSASDASKPSYARPTYDGNIAGKVSGRTWKHVHTQRSSATRVSHRGSSLEVRTKEKELKRAFKERVNELKEGIRLNKVEKRRKKEEREKKKRDNILMSGTKLQVITNPKTLQKIAKSKDRKLLKSVPDEVVYGGKKRNTKK